jgi:hypothetical protein
MTDPHDDPDFEATKAAVEHSISQADSGETMTVAESKARTIETILRVAAEVAAEQA